jgi:hypothetical protein
MQKKQKALLDEANKRIIATKAAATDLTAFATGVVQSSKNSIDSLYKSTQGFHKKYGAAVSSRRQNRQPNTTSFSVRTRQSLTQDRRIEPMDYGSSLSKTKSKSSFSLGSPSGSLPEDDNLKTPHPQSSNSEME